MLESDISGETEIRRVRDTYIMLELDITGETERYLHYVRFIDNWRNRDT